jgi:hypothetical protein
MFTTPWLDFSQGDGAPAGQGYERLISTLAPRRRLRTSDVSLKKTLLFSDAAGNISSHNGRSRTSRIQ